MKVFNIFAHIFTIFAFLTFGSLLIIVGLHILSLGDAVIRVQEIYNSGARSAQVVFLGFLFISVGLAFTKMLVKKGKTDALILQGENGPVVIPVNTIEDLTKKILKRFTLIKKSSVNISVSGKDVKVNLSIVVWSGAQIQELLFDVQEQCRERLSKLISVDANIEISCDVEKIEDHNLGRNKLNEKEVLTA